MKMKSRGRKLLHVLMFIALIIFSQLTFLGTVHAPPVPIGDPLYTQSNPFESNPTTSSASGTTPTGGAPQYAFDGDTTSLYRFSYNAVPSGYFNVSSFKNAPPSPFTIAWVDFKIEYATATTSTGNYSIVYRVGNAGPVVLQDWVSGASAQFGDPGNPPYRAWSNQTEPNDGVWDWTDIGNVQISFEIEGVDGAQIYLYDFWLTIYAVPPPSSPILPSGISVQPAAVLNLAAGSIFFVDIYAVNLTKMWGYQFKLTFNPDVLILLEWFSYNPFNGQVVVGSGSDYVYLAYSSKLGDTVGLSGNGPIARIYFAVQADGLSSLHFSPPPVTRYVDTLGNPHDFDEVSDGVFATVPFHDVMISNVTTNATTIIVRPGKSLTINVTVMNNGTYYENFNVTVKYDDTIIAAREILNFGPGLGTTAFEIFMWNTAGVPLGFHQIKANATVVSGDTNPGNNEYIDGTLLVGRHDITVTDVMRISPSNVTVPAGTILTVTRGQIMYVNVTVANAGDFPETGINVTAQWNIYPTLPNVHIGTVTNVALGVGASATLSFSYNTSTGWSFPTGVNSIAGAIQGQASAVQYEEGVGYDFTSDNKMIDGTLNVTEPVVPNYPTASFTATPTTAFMGQPVKFDASASTTPDDTTIVEYKWDFNDGNVTTVTSPIVYHKFSAKGTYNVMLIVKNDADFTDTTNSTITVLKRNIALVSVVPSTTSVLVGQTLSINVTLINQGDNSETFNVTAYYDNTAIGTSRISVTAGTTQSVIFSWDTTGVNPKDYTIKASLEALSYETNSTDNTLADGSVSVKWHNIAVTSVTMQPTSVLTGATVTINVTVVNQGNFTESFTVTAKYGTTDITSQTVSGLAPDSSKTLTFSWNTAGVGLGRYEIKALASTVAGETKIDDNLLSGGFVSVVWHNIAVTSVQASPTDVVAGDDVAVSVTVVNQGNFTESFTVTAKYGTANIEIQNVNNLVAGASKTLTFEWDTTDVIPDSYVISAVASTVVGETKITDNSLTGNSITVTAEEEEAGPSIDPLVIGGVAAVIAIIAVVAYLLLRRRS